MGAMKSPLTLYLLRHGTTEYNAANRMQGRIDLPLSPLGCREAESAREALMHEFLDQVVCSPMKRARETAAIATRGRTLPFRVEESFAEIDIGDWEGLKFEEVQRSNPDFHQRWLADPRERIPGGESFSDVCERVRPGVEALLAGPASAVLVSGHATVNRAILAALMEMPPEIARRFRVLNASLSCLIRIPHASESHFVVESWNRVCHLENLI